MTRSRRPSPRAMRRVLDGLQEITESRRHDDAGAAVGFVGKTDVTAAAIDAIASGKTPFRRGAVKIVYDPTIATEICERIEAGDTLHVICADPHIPSEIVINRWKKERPDFAIAYAQAREASAEACEHNAIREAELAHDRDSAAVANVRARVWQWAAGVRNPKTHGNKLDATITLNVGLADRLNAAMARVTVIDGEIVPQTGSVAPLEADGRPDLRLSRL